MIKPKEKENSPDPGELSYRHKYEAIVHFLYHEYVASLSTFQGLVMIAEDKEDPLLEHFQKEFEKYKERARKIGQQHADL